MFAVPRQATKAAKDALQALGMLDRARKAEQMAGGSCIALPLSHEAATQLQALAPTSHLTDGAQQSLPSQTTHDQSAEPGVTGTTATCNSDSKPLSAVPDGDSAANKKITLKAASSEAGSFDTLNGHSSLHGASAHYKPTAETASSTANGHSSLQDASSDHKPTAGNADSATSADVQSVKASRGQQMDADGSDGRHKSAAPVEEAARGILEVLLGLLRSGVAQLEWRELLASRRAGGPSPAAKLRAGMQQLLSAHGEISGSHESSNRSRYMVVHDHDSVM